MAAPQFTFSPNALNFVYYLYGTWPAIQSFNILHNSGFDGSGDYEEIYAKYTLEYKTGQPNDWIDNSNTWGAGDLFNISSGLDDNLIFGINKVNVDTYIVGQKLSCRIKFETIGYNSPSTYDILNTQYVDIVLDLKNSSDVDYSPNYLEFKRVLTTPLDISRILTVSGTNWIFSLGLFSNIFEVIPITPGIIYNPISKEYAGDGEAQLQIKLKPVVDSSPIGSYVCVFLLNNTSGGRIIYTYIDILDFADFYASPESLSFESVIGYAPALTQLLYLKLENDFEFILPDWVTIAPPTGLGEATVTVQANIPLAGEGVYNDVIIVKNTTTLVEYEIPITHTVLDIGTTVGDLNFTLDDAYIEVETDKTNTYFTVQMLVKTYEFYTNALKEFTLNYKLPLFQNKQKLYIGAIMHRLIKSFPELNVLNLYNKIHTVDLVVKEISNLNESVITTAVQQNLRFVPGYQPQTVIEGNCILNKNPYPTRITPKSFAYLNVYLVSGSYPYKIYKNGTEVDSGIMEAIAYNILSTRINFDDYEATKGDTFEVKIQIGEGEGVQYLTQKYLCFPEGAQSNMIIWEDEYKNRQALEFTGEYTLGNEKEYITHKYQNQLVEVLKKYKTKNEFKLTINTGWLLKTDNITVESILDSKRAWLVLSESPNDFMEMVCMTKPILNIDSQRQLISYDLEFTINKSSYAKIYNF